MLETTKILYRELHYQMIKRNPLIANDEKRFRRAMKRIDIKRNLLSSSLPFIFFGFFISSAIALSDDRIVILSFVTSVSLLPFVFALYVTAVHSSYIVSLGLFESLKSLPIKTGAIYLSELLLIDSLPSLAILLPSMIILLVKFPFAGILFILWILVGLFLGHTIGLLVFSLFGLRISHRKSRLQSVKSIMKILALLVFMGIFYALSYLQRYLADNSEKFASLFEKYEVAYPFSVSSIFEPQKSMLLLIGYLVVFFPLYYFSINRVWEDILEPKLSFVTRKTSFKAGSGGVIFALALKDLKIIFRRASMIAGFLIPIYFVLPQVFIIIKKGYFPEGLAISLLFIIATFSTVGATIILKIEGKELDFLRTLPISKSQFALSKAIAMSLIPVILCIAIVLLNAYFNQSLYLFLHAFLLPLNVSLLTMIFLFRYEGEEIGIPEISMLRTFFLLILNGLMLGIIVLPAFIISLPYGLVASYTLAMIMLYLMLKKLIPEH